MADFEELPEGYKAELAARHAFMSRKHGVTIGMTAALILRDQPRDLLALITESLHTQIEGMKRSGAAPANTELATTTLLAIKAIIEDRDDQEANTNEEKLVEGKIEFDPKAPVGSGNPEYDALMRMMREATKGEDDDGKAPGSGQVG